MSGNLKRAGEASSMDKEEEDSNEQILSQVNPVKIASPGPQSDHSEDEHMVLTQPAPVKKSKGVGKQIGVKVARVKKKKKVYVPGK